MVRLQRGSNPGPSETYFEVDADAQMVRTQVPGRDMGIYALTDHFTAVKSDKVEIKGRN